MSANQHLCRYCHAFFSEHLDVTHRRLWRNSEGKIERRQQPYDKNNHRITWRPHWPTFIEFMDSAMRGCHLCALFLLQVTPHEQHMFRSFEPTNTKRSCKIGIQDALDRRLGRYDLELSHPIFEDMQKKLSNRTRNTMILHMQQTNGS